MRHGRSIVCALVFGYTFLLATLVVAQAPATDISERILTKETIQSRLREGRPLEHVTLPAALLEDAILGLYALGEDVAALTLLNCIVEGPLDIRLLGTLDNEIQYPMPEQPICLRIEFPVTLTDCVFGDLGISQTATIDRVEFCCDVLIVGCRFRLAVLDDCTFEQALLFVDCEVDELSLRDVSCRGIAQFSRLAASELDASGGRFDGVVDLWRCTIAQATHLNECVFLDRCDLRGASFLGPVDLSQATFHSDVETEGLRFLADVKLDKESLAGISQEERENLYRLASRGWELVGSREEADHFFRLEMVERRSTKSPLVRGLEIVLVDWTCGYGTSWMRVLLSWCIVIVGCSLVLWLGKGVRRAGVGRLRGSRCSVWECVHYSIASFLGMRLDRYETREGFGWIATTTALFGAILLALLVAVFVRQFMR